VLSRPLRSLSPEISPGTSERCDQPARICDSTRGAPGGLQRPKEHKRALAQLTQPMPVQCWQLDHSKWFNQGLGPGHAAIPSSYPSKPVAPGWMEDNAEGKDGKDGKGGKVTSNQIRSVSETCKQQELRIPGIKWVLKPFPPSFRSFPSFPLPPCPLHPVPAAPLCHVQSSVCLGRQVVQASARFRARRHSKGGA
jgi:hypothetical protein